MHDDELVPWAPGMADVDQDAPDAPDAQMLQKPRIVVDRPIPT